MASAPALRRGPAPPAPRAPRRRGPAASPATRLRDDALGPPAAQVSAASRRSSASRATALVAELDAPCVPPVPHSLPRESLRRVGAPHVCSRRTHRISHFHLPQAWRGVDSKSGPPNPGLSMNLDDPPRLHPAHPPGKPPTLVAIGAVAHSLTHFPTRTRRRSPAPLWGVGGGTRRTRRADRANIGHAPRNPVRVLAVGHSVGRVTLAAAAPPEAAAAAAALRREPAPGRSRRRGGRRCSGASGCSGGRRGGIG